ncbi:nicotinate-nucleotide adenylyltransferase [Acidihalobacter ferrooxydans]|uniref:Probable nicotinate-nucleotide adenylyltransferase n=1 Tax=Acidihalobacter ferrooxydans TaxID=1765967 RepID=A0A1P8UI41_9GAMM|nr:nicotinate-nucleotide adenylyltransferase [Acidihalobacter ferrooxydans]APZ43515.1 nicotinic acid mononucleotide adenylyltransferase [Acidihalobacter ferrooxydans]
MIGLLGGTFDPIHFGHLRPALEIRDALGLDELRFLPCRIPPHRGTPRESAQTRAALVAQALADEAGFALDRRELGREGPSYTVDTLESFRAELGAQVGLCWIMGRDAFNGLPKWHRPHDVLRLAHIVVAQRPGEEGEPGAALAEMIAGRVSESLTELTQQPAGCVAFVDVTQLAISATMIREALARGQSARFLVPERVWETIRAEGLYGWKNAATEAANSG